MKHLDTKYLKINRNCKETDAQTNYITYLAPLRCYIKLPCALHGEQKNSCDESTHSGDIGAQSGWKYRVTR